MPRQVCHLRPKPIARPYGGGGGGGEGGETSRVMEAMARYMRFLSRCVEIASVQILILFLGLKEAVSAPFYRFGWQLFF